MMVLLILVIVVMPIYGEKSVTKSQLDEELFFHATLPCVLHAMSISLKNSFSDTSIGTKQIYRKGCPNKKH